MKSMLRAASGLALILLLVAGGALAQPTAESSEPANTGITLEAELLETYTGRYELRPGIVLTITRDDGRLSAQLADRSAVEIYPATETEFLYRAVDARISFRTDDRGRVNSVILHQNGIDQLARKLDTDADPVEEWFGHRETSVDPGLFDDYVGQYAVRSDPALPPGPIFTVTREGDALFVQVAAEQRLQVYPEGEHEFFYKAVDAQITFETDDDGKVTALILHQSGPDVRAGRIE